MTTSKQEASGACQRDCQICQNNKWDCLLEYGHIILLSIQAGFWFLVLLVLGMNFYLWIFFGFIQIFVDWFLLKKTACS